jgi:uncharacterized RDD family membrane protein YckC
MNCPACGEVCRCFSEPPPTASQRWKPDAESLSASAPSLVRAQGGLVEPHLVDPESSDLSEQRFVASLDVQGEPAAPGVSGESAAATLEPEQQDSPLAEAGAPPADQDPAAWREELAARLTRYRARRKPRPPRYPSLRLAFDAPLHGSTTPDSAASAGYAFDSTSNALALDSLTLDGPGKDGLIQDRLAEALLASPSASAVSPPRVSSAEETFPPPKGQSPVPVGAKIIEFPRSFGMAPPTSINELAEPVIDRPRILEVPEVAPPPPALGGITMEAAHQPGNEKRPGIDIPLQSAPLARRIVATVVDGLIISSASAIFGFIFWKVAAVRPPLAQLLGLAAGVPCVFWAAYQYLMVVHSASTPGVRVAGLELARFDGTPPNRRLRRWRVLASYLSAASLGMGYAWLFLDEDALCWHDRATHTYFAPQSKRREKAKSNSPA